MPQGPARASRPRTRAARPSTRPSLQIPGVLDDLFTYDGAARRHASTHDRVPTLRVWAPTARSVKLHLFADSSPATPTVLDDDPRPATGVWSVDRRAAAGAGRYYLYEVEVFVALDRAASSATW